MLDIIFGIALWVVVIIGIFFILIPIGNENSTVRRPPWVTFSIIGLNVVIFFATLPAVSQQAVDVNRTRTALDKFLLDHDELKADPDIRRALQEAGVISKREVDEIDRQMNADPQYKHDWELWLKGSEAETLRTQCRVLLLTIKPRPSQAFGIGTDWLPTVTGKFTSLLRRHSFMGASVTFCST